MKPNHYFKPYTKINSKCIKDSKVRPKTIKFVEENIGIKLLDVGLGNAVMNQKQKQQKKSKQVELHQIKTILCSKGSHKKIKKEANKR